MAHLTDEQADKVFSILVQFGVHKNLRRDFVDYVTRPNHHLSKEYRFMGEFGMGGKLYISLSGVRAGYYVEDDSPSFRKRIKELNLLLEAFQPVIE